MMLAVRSHANAKIIQLVRCKFKVSWVKFVGIRPTQIYYQLKKIIEYVKDLFYGSRSRNFLAPAVDFVIFMAQRPFGEQSPAEKEREVYENFIKFPKVLTAAGI